ncbi:protein aurora borealis [Elysia marginata]|uniref:Protein aurora borealis n=1 Tax=Elysia marginata TaxID=1093978 RepID=A0AAV4FB60_9GAST|nr:protein aurora borealis [Elysia marginata]
MEESNLADKECSTLARNLVKPQSNSGLPSSSPSTSVVKRIPTSPSPKKGISVTPSSQDMGSVAACDIPSLPSPISCQSSHVDLFFPGSDVSHTSEIPSRKQRLDNKVSPEGKKFLKYQSPGKPDMRHQLLVQRTFSPHDEKLEPRTSSPMRKVRAFADTLGCSPIRSTPSSACSNTKEPSHSQHSNRIIPFVSPHVENVGLSSDVQAIFKTPIRAQHSSGDNNGHYTPSRQTLSLFSSPAGSSSSVFTPGRNFVNPFEMDTDRLHVPAFSPSIFNIGSACSSAQKNESQGFWSVEQTAMLMPVNIKDSDVQRQMRYQQRIDREQDEKVQSAINAFFSNELIVPSPWSEKVNHFLPRTPGSTNSVSCQTTLSVPPGVDLLAELGGKYNLPEYKTDPSPPIEAMGNSFIRRKLLNQLNDNDNEILSPPVLPARTQEKMSSSPILSPGKRQSTPEWEQQQTPNKHTSGHFSSSPIREEPDEKGHHPAMSESELLASPELSPVAGSRPSRFSGIYYSDQDMENPRAIMQLDFSSILEDESGGEEEVEGDKLGTLIQQTATENQPSAEFSSNNSLHTSTELQALQASNISSQDGEALPSTQSSSTRPLLCSALSVGSGLDTVCSATAAAQLGSSQDTGYYTTSLLQSTTNLAMSSSNSLPMIEGGSGPLVPDLLTSNSKMGAEGGLSELTGAKYESDSGNGVSCLGSSSEAPGRATGMSFATKDDGFPHRKREPFLVRKIRALSDIRLAREKRNVSRDLTQSFNMDCSTKSEELRHSFSDNDIVNVIKRSVSKNKLEGMVVGEPSHTNMHSVHSSNFSSNHTKSTPVVLSTPMYEVTSTVGQLQSNGNTTTESPSLKEPDTPVRNFQSRFSLGDDDTLEQARQLLGKSEQLRQRHLQLDSLNSSDAFQQALMSASDENIDPSDQASAAFNSQVSVKSKGQLEDSLSTPRILESIEKNIQSVQSSQLGSEIAAEILKRAGDDLAKVTDILDSGPSSPR